MALRRFYVDLSAWLHQRETEALASLPQKNRTLRAHASFMMSSGYQPAASQNRNTFFCFWLNARRVG